jgi:hypothetical protein
MVRKIKLTAILATILTVPPLASDVSANGLDPERATRTRGWIDQWFSYRENADGSREYKLTERLYVALGVHGGWRLTGRLDVPWIDTNETGSANANGLWAGRVGDIHTEIYVESPPLTPGLTLGGSLRLVWPTGGQSPFGNEQYQWAPALFLTYRLPVFGYDLTLQPLGRYYMSYWADRADA